MLVSFTIKGYGCFNDEQCLDMTQHLKIKTRNQVVYDDDFSLPIEFKNKSLGKELNAVNKVTGIFGKNGTGKSCILDALFSGFAYPGESNFVKTIASISNTFEKFFSNGYDVQVEIFIDDILYEYNRKYNNVELFKTKNKKNSRKHKVVTKKEIQKVEKHLRSLVCKYNDCWPAFDKNSAMECPQIKEFVSALGCSSDKIVKICSLLKVCLLEQQKVVLIDNITDGLSEKVVKQIIYWFTSYINKMNSQLIFTSHSTGVLNSLSPNQIIILLNKL